ncbi:MAG: ferredoxin reductase family protein [Pseudomonadota bacterium]
MLDHHRIAQMPSECRHQTITAPVLSPAVRGLSGLAIIALAAGFLCFFVMIAAVAGDRDTPETMLSPAAKRVVAAGDMFALGAAALVLMQLCLACRFKFLDRIFGLSRLLAAHRAVGVSAVALGTLHPLFIFAPAQRALGPLRPEIWPAMVGMALLAGLWAAVCLSLWRGLLRLAFPLWWRMHRAGAFVGTMLLGAHVLNVNGDFEQGWPRWAFIAALVAYGAVLMRHKAVKPALLRSHGFTVTGLSQRGRNVYAVELSPVQGAVFSYLPGQFAFVSFQSLSLSAEEHHFTLSSTPTRPGSIIFTIKSSGDFTACIGSLRAGDTAFVDGPYGLFSHLARGRHTAGELIMIAGGIGITPMLSMLRYMSDVQDKRALTLVWSNRTSEDIFCREELESIGRALPHLAIHYVLTREADSAGNKVRLDAGTLQHLLDGCSRGAAVFICGPPPLMHAVTKGLAALGFKRRQIFTERFSL